MRGFHHSLIYLVDRFFCIIRCPAFPASSAAGRISLRAVEPRRSHGIKLHEIGSDAQLHNAPLGSSGDSRGVVLVLADGPAATAGVFPSTAEPAGRKSLLVAWQSTVIRPRGRLLAGLSAPDIEGHAGSAERGSRVSAAAGRWWAAAGPDGSYWVHQIFDARHAIISSTRTRAPAFRASCLVWSGIWLDLALLAELATEGLHERGKRNNPPSYRLLLVG